MTDFEEKVQKMRQLQKQYFESRDSLTLQACKKAEREVDSILAMTPPKSTSKNQKDDLSQRTLFPSSELHSQARYAPGEELRNGKR